MNVIRSSEAIFKARDVHVAFGEALALRGIDLDVEPGDFIAVQGPSGSGKSTLLMALAGIQACTSGYIDFEGAPFSALSDDDRAACRLRNIGVVRQFGELIPELSLLENVALPLLVAGMQRANADGVAAAALGELGVANLAQKLPSEVSGGQGQRAAVARAIVTNPRVVLADEPTGALDRASGRAVMDMLLRVTVSRGAALVVATHDMQLASQATTRVQVVDGRRA